MLPEIPPCDLLLLAGDLCGLGAHTVGAQAEFLNEEFRAWLENIPARQIVGVAGNHDWIFEESPDLVPHDLRWHYLLDTSITIDHLKIHGTPWQPRFCDWAFNLDEPDLAKKWELIPDDTDILICHGPPRGIGDRTLQDTHTGSPSLLAAIQRIQPRLTVFGHIHEARGRWTLPARRHPEIQLANVSQMDGRFNAIHPPMMFTI